MRIFHFFVRKFGGSKNLAALMVSVLLAGCVGELSSEECKMFESHLKTLEDIHASLKSVSSFLPEDTLNARKKSCSDIKPLIAKIPAIQSDIFSVLSALNDPKNITGVALSKLPSQNKGAGSSALNEKKALLNAAFNRLAIIKKALNKGCGFGDQDFHLAKKFDGSSDNLFVVSEFMIKEDFLDKGNQAGLVALSCAFQSIKEANISWASVKRGSFDDQVTDKKVKDMFPSEGTYTTGDAGRAAGVGR